MDNDFDALPYISMPIGYTEPSRLAALAVLHGLPAPDAESARVLELGCASGGNIIPLAARYRNAQFLGVDISHTHIEMARQRIEALGLKNIEIQQADLATHEFSGRTFDYIVCHGVFSWVPQPVRDAILSICEKHLAATGIAAISYNVLPGWNLRNVVRDICLHHAGTVGTPARRAARARAILNQIASTADAEDAYGRVVVNEARRMARQPASYIVGEFLAPYNAPCAFGEFTRGIAQYNLSWLCEGELPSSVPETIAPKAAASIRALAGNDDLALQEYIDLFSGRTFRRSVLIRNVHAAAQSPPAPDRLKSLHVASTIKPDPGNSHDQASSFVDRRGVRITVKNPAVRRALTKLAERFPATTALADLTDGDAGIADCQTVAAAVFRLLMFGRAQVSTCPLSGGRADAAFPRIWDLAQTEAATGQPWVTSRGHTAVFLTPLQRLLMAKLDGQHDRATLGAFLVDAHRTGVFNLENDPAASSDGTIQVPLNALATSRLDTVLDYFASNSLLMPDNVLA